MWVNKKPDRVPFVRFRFWAVHEIVIFVTRLFIGYLVSELYFNGRPNPRLSDKHMLGTCGFFLEGNVAVGKGGGTPG